MKSGFSLVVHIISHSPWIVTATLFPSIFGRHEKKPVLRHGYVPHRIFQKHCRVLQRKKNLLLRALFSQWLERIFALFLYILFHLHYRIQLRLRDDPTCYNMLLHNLSVPFVYTVLLRQSPHHLLGSIFCGRTLLFLIVQLFFSPPLLSTFFLYPKAITPASRHFKQLFTSVSSCLLSVRYS